MNTNMTFTDATIKNNMNNSDDFSLEYRLSHGNMHIDLHGDFTTSSAKEFIHCLTRVYEGTGRVFVETENLKALSDSGIRYFRDYLSSTKVLAHNLYLKGERGFQLVPNGSKVLISSKKSKDARSSCACGGTCGGANAKHEDGVNTGHKKCKVCKCALARQRAAQRDEQSTNI